MDTTTALLLLVILGQVTLGSFTCDPEKPVGNKSEKDIEVSSGMSPGCWSRYRTVDGSEVHVLDLVFSTNSDNFFLMHLAAVNKPHVVLNSRSELPVKGYLNNGENVTFYITDNTTEIDKPAVVFKAALSYNTTVLDWAKKKFGGVTSFTTIYDPLDITFTGMQADIKSTECNPEKGFFPKPYLLEGHLKYKPAFKLCFSGNHKLGNKLHIINIPDSVPVQEVFIQVISPKETELFLRGPNGTVWNFEEPTNLISNNKVQMKFNGSQVTICPSLTNVTDNYKDVQLLALKKFGSNFTYTEITEAKSKIRLVIKEKTSNVPYTQTPPGSVPSLSIQLYESADYKTRIEPMTKVQSEKRIYAEIASSSGEVKMLACSVQSKNSCHVEIPMAIQEEHCPGNVCGNSSRFSFSFQQIQDLPLTFWDLECKIQICPRRHSDMKCHYEVKGTLQVIKSSLPSKSCVDSDLSAVLGVAFGGFLIGVLLMGALWFIKVRTGMGFVSTSPHIPGCPSSLAKRQPVSGNTVPSQDSSTSPSIGSTQSTPTSSMA